MPSTLLIAGPEWADSVEISGFSCGCSAIRVRKSSLVVPGEAVVAERVIGNALEVLQAVCEWPWGSG